MKSTKVEGPYFINNFIFDESKKTKRLFSLWMDNTSSSNAILFLTFQTIQKIHKGPTLQTSFLFFPQRTCPTPKASPYLWLTTPTTPQRERKTNPIKSLSWHNGGGCDLSILHAFDKGSIYLLKAILFSGVGPK